MIIQMMKQKNPEHDFYIPYIQPVKASVEQAIKDGKMNNVELESFILPKEATILIDCHGSEGIFVDGQLTSVMTEIPSGIVYLLSQEIYMKVEKHIIKKGNVINFPNVNHKVG